MLTDVLSKLAADVLCMPDDVRSEPTKQVGNNHHETENSSHQNLSHETPEAPGVSPLKNAAAAFVESGALGGGVESMDAFQPDAETTLLDPRSSLLSETGFNLPCTSLNGSASSVPHLTRQASSLMSMSSRREEPRTRELSRRQDTRYLCDSAPTRRPKSKRTRKSDSDDDEFIPAGYRATSSTRRRVGTTDASGTRRQSSRTEARQQVSEATAAFMEDLASPLFDNRRRKPRRVTSTSSVGGMPSFSRGSVEEPRDFRVEALALDTQGTSLLGLGERKDLREDRLRCADMSSIGYPQQQQPQPHHQLPSSSSSLQSNDLPLLRGISSARASAASAHASQAAVTTATANVAPKPEFPVQDIVAPMPRNIGGSSAMPIDDNEFKDVKGVYKNCRGIWAAQWTDEKGQRHTKYFNPKFYPSEDEARAEAYRFKMRVIQDIERKGGIQRRRIRSSTAADEYIRGSDPSFWAHFGGYADGLPISGFGDPNLAGQLEVPFLQYMQDGHYHQYGWPHSNAILNYYLHQQTLGAQPQTQEQTIAMEHSQVPAWTPNEAAIATSNLVEERKREPPTSLPPTPQPLPFDTAGGFEGSVQSGARVFDLPGMNSYEAAALWGTPPSASSEAFMSTVCHPLTGSLFPSVGGTPETVGPSAIPRISLTPSAEEEESHSSPDSFTACEDKNDSSQFTDTEISTAPPFPVDAPAPPADDAPAPLSIACDPLSSFLKIFPEDVRQMEPTLLLEGGGEESVVPILEEAGGDEDSEYLACPSAF